MPNCGLFPKTRQKAGLWKKDAEAPELFLTVSYSIEGETLTISEDRDSFTASLNEDYTGLRTNIDGEGECVFYKQ